MCNKYTKYGGVSAVIRITCTGTEDMGVVYVFWGNDNNVYNGKMRKNCVIGVFYFSQHAPMLLQMMMIRSESTWSPL